MSVLLLGIDLGTASSKGVLTTPDGEIVASAARPRPRSVSMPRPGWAEVDARGVWWADVVELARELVDRAGELGGDIVALTVSGVGPCLVLTDDRGEPLRPAILYGIDMRAVQEIELLTERYGTDAVLATCGTPLTSQAIGPKALWVERHEPEVWAQTRRWFSASSFVVWHLTGEYVLDRHTASQCVPLFDQRTQEWHPDWYADVMGSLPAPRLAWPAEVVGTISAAAAEATGLRAGTPVCAGTVDAWAEAFSCGVRRPGDLMLMYGSTMFFVQVLDAPAPHPQLWNTLSVDPDSHCLAAGMSTSGSLTEWARHLVGDVPFETLVSEASAVPPGSDGLLVLPYFAGERTPIFDDRARGVIAGLTLSHGRGHLLRAIYEGVGFGIRQILELLDTPANPVRRVVAVGGGTRGRLWTQIVSDVTGRDQEVPRETVGAAYGDALMAAVGAGLVPPSTDWAEIVRVVTPVRERRSTYDELYRAYGDLHPATVAHQHLLADLQERSTRG